MEKQDKSEDCLSIEDASSAATCFCEHFLATTRAGYFFLFRFSLYKQRKMKGPRGPSGTTTPWALVLSRHFHRFDETVLIKLQFIDADFTLVTAVTPQWAAMVNDVVLIGSWNIDD